MNILVTVGTQEQEFNRLFSMVESLDLTGCNVVVQCGTANYQNERFSVSSMLEDFDEVVANSDLIITHGGVGSIISALKLKKKIIAVARLEKYKEHVNDHQLEIVNKYEADGYILTANDNVSMQNALTKINDFVPKEFVSNNENFIVQLDKIIGELC